MATKTGLIAGVRLIREGFLLYTVRVFFVEGVDLCEIHGILQASTLVSTDTHFFFITYLIPPLVYIATITHKVPPLVHKCIIDDVPKMIIISISSMC